jgi:hypothetical protein
MSENTGDRSALAPYRIAQRVDLSQMSPAARGTDRSCPANYVGGRMHGMISPAGWHGLRRDEVGRDLDDDVAREIPHYVLFRSNSGNLLHYIHSSLLPDPECA